ncbi:MAG: HemK/PrmC family methyltransferase, partial [Candidatus Margulisiibacteriota bacterium]
MTIAEALAFGITRLSNLEDPRLETEILLAHALKIKRSTLITDQLRAIEPLRQTFFEQFIARRLKYEPTAYIVGYQPFLGLDFKVDKRVLIPRPETELLVENALSLISHSSLDICHFSVVDVGTGSGCIAITLAKKIP